MEPYEEVDELGWPDKPEDAQPGAFADETGKAKLEVRKKRTDHEIARRQAQEALEDAVELEYYKGVLEVAKGSIERARASAETIQKAAAALVTLYTGVLALAFSVSDTALPGRALFAALFLGAAIALATAFLAYLPDEEAGGKGGEPVEGSGTTEDQLVNSFVTWTRKTALKRAGFLRSAVVMLVGAVLLLPAPFVEIGGEVNAPQKLGAWPAPDPVVADDPELAKVLYEAQVAEAAEQRKQPIAADQNQELWLVIVGLTVLVALCAYFSPRLRAEEH